jgi:hypothetical protein
MSYVTDYWSKSLLTALEISKQRHILRLDYAITTPIVESVQIQFPSLSEGHDEPVQVVCLELMRSWVTDSEGEEQCFASTIVLRSVEEGGNTWRRIGFAIIPASAVDEFPSLAEFIIV